MVGIGAVKIWIAYDLPLDFSAGIIELHWY